MRVICSAARALSAPGRLSTMTGWPIWSESAWPIMRVVGSAEPPGGKPTMNRMGFAGYCAKPSVEAAVSSSASAMRCIDLSFLLPKTQEPFQLGLPAGALARLEFLETGVNGVVLHQRRERIVKDDRGAAMLLERTARHVDDHRRPVDAPAHLGELGRAGPGRGDHVGAGPRGEGRARGAVPPHRRA